MKMKSQTRKNLFWALEVPFLDPFLNSDAMEQERDEDAREYRYFRETANKHNLEKGKGLKYRALKICKK